MAEMSTSFILDGFNADGSLGPPADLPSYNEVTGPAAAAVAEKPKLDFLKIDSLPAALLVSNFPRAAWSLNGIYRFKRETSAGEIWYDKAPNLWLRNRGAYIHWNGGQWTLRSYGPDEGVFSYKDYSVETPIGEWTNGITVTESVSVSKHCCHW